MRALVVYAILTALCTAAFLLAARHAWNEDER